MPTPFDETGQQLAFDSEVGRSVRVDLRRLDSLANDQARRVGFVTEIRL
jgi:hypothetical protein